MLAQQMHGYNGEQHEIAVKNELPACTRENGLSSCLWERSTVINQSSNLLQIFQWGPSQGSGHKTAKLEATINKEAAQNPVHPSSDSTATGATEDTLGDEDLFEIKCYLLDLDKNHIYNLGLALGLSQRKVKMTNYSDTFLDDVLVAWLRREDSVEKKGVSSWRTLVRALRHKLLGQNGIASDICSDKGI